MRDRSRRRSPWPSTRLRALELGDAFDPRAARVLVDAGLHRLAVPEATGGLGATMAEAAEVLLAIGAVDGSTALGFAMQVHTTGALRDGQAADDVRELVWRAVVDDGALLNNAATEEGGGSPARGAIPGTRAVDAGDGTWRLTGEKTWTTWLPNLTHAFVTARLDDDERPRTGRFWVDLAARASTRREGFEALGMRGSASGRLVLDGAPGPAPAAPRAPARPIRRGRRRSPGSGSASRPPTSGSGSARGRGRALGARPTARRWLDGRGRPAQRPAPARPPGRRPARRPARAPRGRPALGRATRDPADVALAKLVATRAAVDATDEALRIAGGPGFLAGPLERAFRDARAGLINPPLEDVALAGFAARLLDEVRGDG